MTSGADYLYAGSESSIIVSWTEFSMLDDGSCEFESYVLWKYCYSIEVIHLQSLVPTQMLSFLLHQNHRMGTRSCMCKNVISKNETLSTPEISCCLLLTPTS